VFGGGRDLSALLPVAATGARAAARCSLEMEVVPPESSSKEIFAAIPSYIALRILHSEFLNLFP
jgi:hypothetical protein